MQNAWDVYYKVFLSALLSLGIPLVLSLLARVVSGKPAPRGRSSASSRPAAPVGLGKRVNTRFFMAANAGIVLLSIALLLVPCVVALRAPTADGAVRGLLAVVSLATFGGLGLLYAARKGDLGWLESFSREKDGS